ncbi:MAG: phosphate ABC transporter substrate-binding protein PstS, partial [Deltaproteobacteria bacterium]
MKRIIGMCIGLCLFLYFGFCSAANLTLLGAGATFPYPLYDKWFHVYEKISKIKINYQPIGSGGGIRQLINRVVD